MAKGVVIDSWLEVAPLPIIVPNKPSHSPKLETIEEDRAEGHDDTLIGDFKSNWFNQNICLFLCGLSEKIVRKEGRLHLIPRL